MFSHGMAVKGGIASAKRHARDPAMLARRNAAIRRAYANPELRKRLSRLAFERGMATVETRRRNEAERLLPQWVRDARLKGEWKKVYLRTLCEIEAAAHVRSILARLGARP